jgi:hypothetical protein
MRFSRASFESRFRIRTNRSSNRREAFYDLSICLCVCLLASSFGVRFCEKVYSRIEHRKKRNMGQRVFDRAAATRWLSMARPPHRHVRKV